MSKMIRGSFEILKGAHRVVSKNGKDNVGVRFLSTQPAGGGEDLSGQVKDIYDSICDGGGRFTLYGVAASTVTGGAFKYGIPYWAYTTGDPILLGAGIAVGWGAQILHPPLLARRATRIGPTFSKGLAMNLMEALYKKPIGEINSDPLGEINQTFIKALNSVWKVPNQLFGTIAPSIVHCGCSVAAMSFISPPVAAGFAAFAYAQAVLATSKGGSKEEQDGFMATVYATVGKTLGHVDRWETTVTHNQQDREIKDYDKTVETFKNALADNLRSKTSLSVYQAMLTVAGMFGLFSSIAYQAKTGVLSGMQSSLLVFYLSQGVLPLTEITRSYNELKDSLGDYRKVKLFSDTSYQRSTSVPHRTLKLTSAPRISFDNVSFQYEGGDVIFDSATFELHPGEKTVMVGLSGAGKSTVIKLLMRFYELDAGSISVDDCKISEVDPRELRGAISVVPQNPLIFDGTIKDNITYANPNASEEDISDAIRKAQLDEVVSSYSDGLDAMVGKQGAKLSGGVKQRVAIARALLQDDAYICIFDEATSALDIATERSVMDALDPDIEGKTALVITHRLNMIPLMRPDKVIVVDQGQVIEEGAYEDLLKAGGRFAEMVRRYDPENSDDKEVENDSGSRGPSL